MSPRLSRPLALGLSAALAAGGLLLASPDLASAAPTPSPSFFGYAYGSTASVGTISSGATAKVNICTALPNKTYGNEIADVNLGTGVGTLGVVTTSVATTDKSDVVTSKTTGTSLLGGLIQASAITSTSTATLGTDGTVSTSGTTQIAGLKILGLSTTVPSGANAKIEIPGIATVTVNGQTTAVKNGLTQRTVNGLRVDLLKNNTLGLPTGTIVLSSAASGVHSPTNFRASGTAYATQLDLAGVVTSGQTALVNLPCGGSNGVSITNSTASASIPGVLSSAAITSSGKSTETATGTTVVMSSKIGGLNLLDGLITADAVSGRATAALSGTKLGTSTAGTEIVGLKVRGEAVEVGTGENSKIDVAGVGTLTLRKVVKSASGLDVYGLELKINTDQVLGPKAGTTLQVAVAKARVTTS